MNLTAEAISLSSLCLLTLYGIDGHDDNQTVAWQPNRKASQTPNKKEDHSFSNGDCRRFRLTASYSEGPGIGYDKSYTSLLGFFSPIDSSDRKQPKNKKQKQTNKDSKLAANIGVGMRYL